MIFFQEEEAEVELFTDTCFELTEFAPKHCSTQLQSDKALTSKNANPAFLSKRHPSNIASQPNNGIDNVENVPKRNVYEDNRALNRAAITSIPATPSQDDRAPTGTVATVLKHLKMFMPSYVINLTTYILPCNDAFVMLFVCDPAAGALPRLPLVIETPFLPSLAPETLGDGCETFRLEETPFTLATPSLAASWVTRSEEERNTGVSGASTAVPLRPMQEKTSVVCKQERRDRNENVRNCQPLDGFQIPTAGIKRRRMHQVSPIYCGCHFHSALCSAGSPKRIEIF